MHESSSPPLSPSGGEPAAELFWQLIDRSPFGLHVVDAQFRLVRVSVGAQKVFARVRPLLGRDFGEVLREMWEEPFATEIIARFRHTQATGETYGSTSTDAPHVGQEEVETFDWKIERVTLPGGEHAVICYFQNITESEVARRNAAFLSQLSQDLATMTEADVLLWTAQQRVGEYLRVQRCYFMEVEPDGYTATVLPVWRVSGPDGAGKYDLRTWGSGEWLERRQHETLGIDDVYTHPFTQEAAPRMAPFGVRAYAVSPYLEEGRWVAALGITSDVPRHWTDDECRLLESVVARVWPIVKRARAEAELARLRECAETQRRQYEAVLSTTPDLVYIFGLDYRFIYANEALLTMWGKTSAEALGKTCWELGYEDWHAEMHAREIDKVVATKQPIRGDVPFTGTHGRRIYDYIFAPIFGPEGEVVAVAGSTRDVTERKEAEEALAQRTEQFETLLNQAPIGVYLLDDQLRFSHLNPQARPVFANVANVVGRDFAEVVHELWPPEHADPLVEIFRHTLATGEPYAAVESGGMPKSGGKAAFFDWRVDRIALPTGRFGVVCYFQEVTVQVQARLAVESASRAKDRFLAVLSHELRTPLTPVLMALSTMGRDKTLPVHLADDVAMMKRNIGLETKLIDDLLDLSRITSGKLELQLEMLEVGETIQRVVSICASQAKERDIRVHFEPGLTRLDLAADPARLQQVLWNVVRNAIKFTPQGGEVWITLQRPTPTRCAIVVRDTGIGIRPEALADIFDAFEQGGTRITQQFGGLGLGLAIGKMLLELHGGSIRAESAGEGQGSTFTIELPIAELSGGQTGTRGALPQRAVTGKRLLLVEDHPDTLRVLARMLRRDGYTVHTAENVGAALKVAAREPFDLLVSDLGLPDGNGCDIMQHVRQKLGVPGIAMSGYGMEEDIRRSRAAGFAEHLVKPVDADVLRAAVQRALAAAPFSG